jgi:hypothetical protein
MEEPKTPKKQVTKREHWLPVTSHLAQFADDGVLQIYRFSETGKKDFTKTAKHLKSSPEGIGFENDLYESPDLPTNAMENYLAQVEANYGKVLEEKIKKQAELTEEDHATIAEYIGALQHRTPRWRDHLHEFLDRVDKMGKQVALAHGAPHGSDKMSKEIEEAKESIFSDSLAIAQDVGSWNALDFCFLVVDDEIFSKMEFITGDHPVSLIDFTMSNGPYGLHPLHETAENIVPLTPKIALLGNRAGITGYKKLDANFIREVNFRTLRSSQQMVISKHEVDDYECKAMIDRFPQSILLKFIRRPRGRMDRQLDKIKKDEKKRQSR